MLACLLTGHTHLDKKFTYGGWWRGNYYLFDNSLSCTCNEQKSAVVEVFSEFFGHGFSVQPLMEVAATFAARNMWVDVQTANHAMRVLAAALAEGDLLLSTLAIEQARRERNRLSLKLYNLLCREIDARRQAERDEQNRLLEAQRAAKLATRSVAEARLAEISKRV